MSNGRKHFSPDAGAMLRCVAQPGKCKLADAAAERLQSMGIEGYDAEALHNMDEGAAAQLTERVMLAETGALSTLGNGLSKAPASYDPMDDPESPQWRASYLEANGIESSRDLADAKALIKSGALSLEDRAALTKTLQNYLDDTANPSENQALYYANSGIPTDELANARNLRENGNLSSTASRGLADAYRSATGNPIDPMDDPSSDQYRASYFDANGLESTEDYREAAALRDSPNVPADVRAGLGAAMRSYSSNPDNEANSKASYYFANGVEINEQAAAMRLYQDGGLSSDGQRDLASAYRDSTGRHISSDVKRFRSLELAGKSLESRADFRDAYDLMNSSSVDPQVKVALREKYRASMNSYEAPEGERVAPAAKPTTLRGRLRAAFTRSR